jgi:outer membrane protein assembly factor BamB
MSSAHLSLVLLGLITGIAGGFIFLLFNLPPAVDVTVRLTDVAAETAAGTLGAPASSAEKVNIEGTFETFDGQPGHTASSWPRFRGADFSNIASPENGSLAETWPAAGPPILWSIHFSEGHSGAAVWNGRVYVMDYDEEREADSLRAFSFADGREIWRRWYKAPTKRNHGVSRTVPAVTDKYIVTMGPRCHVMCVDTDTGDFRWGIDLVADYGAEVPLWYTGQCPLIDDGIAVLAPGGKALMMGVDCETGEVVWQTPNPDRWKMTHSSIVPMTLLGKKMYVYCALGGVFGVSAEKEDRGKLLWKSTRWNHSVNAPSPVAIDDRRIFLTVGYGGGSMMLGLRKENDEFIAEPLFQLDKTVFACEQQTPIFYRNHLFGILPKDASALRGQFVCLDTSGNIVWTSGRTERFGLGPFLIADDKVVILNDNGELTLIRASLTGYEPLARARVLQGRDAWAPMALVDGRLILRDSERMICLDVRKL